MRSETWPLAVLLGVILGIGLGAGTARAQIATENAGAVSPELPVLQESVGFAESERRVETTWGHRFGVSFTRADEVKVDVPVRWLEVDFEAGGTRREANLRGFGDVRVLYNRVLWQADGVLRSTRVGLLAEAHLPTGRDDAETDGVRIPRRLQLGTGDWRVGGGGAFTVIRDRHRFAVAGLFRHRTRHDGLRLGQEIDLDVAYWYRLLPAAFEARKAYDLEVRGVVELLSIYRFRSRVGDRTVEDDGGIVTVAPGLQVYLLDGRMRVEGNLRIPAWEDVDDARGDRIWGAFIAFHVFL